MPAIHLKSVWSCPAEPPPDSDLRLPQGWKLAWHQWETLNALRDPAIDVVFNTAMTGDGKSLAAYLSVLQDRECAIALYPTNALASDQETQVRDYIAKFQPENEPRVRRLSGPELEIYAENEELRKADAIWTSVGESEIAIANPDILHCLHRGAYLTSRENPDKIWSKIDNEIDLFIFDEFHVFDAPQVASVLNTMLLIRATKPDKKFLFLSATPSPMLLERLDKAGFRAIAIAPAEEGKYRFPETPAEAETLRAEHWRQVARAIALEFVPVAPTSKASEAWLKENQNEILQQFLEHPGSKGAIILNSIAAVKRLTPIFRELFASHNLTVRENTGLSGTQEKTASLSADLVIGTSTIDVGVDFKINLLFFESSDAGNFIQRLGRLGRHDGYEQNGQTIHFDRFRAYALVPNFFIERLFAGEGAILQDGQACDRLFFQNAIRDNYRQINDFEGYYKRWAGVQSYSVAKQLSHKNIQQQYAGAFQTFCAASERTFDIKLGQVGKKIASWREFSGHKSGNPIAEEAKSFRGSSPLLCGLYDLTEPNEQDRFKTYDLPGILSNLEIEMWSKREFLETLDQTAQRLEQPIPKSRYKYCLGFVKLRGYREERLDWRFEYPGDLLRLTNTQMVRVVEGLKIWQPDNPWIGLINRRLRQQPLVSYVLPKSVRVARQELRLPMHFQIYAIADEYSIHDAIAPFSIAFGQSALLIDTLAHHFRHN